MKMLTMCFKDPTATYDIVAQQVARQLLLEIIDRTHYSFATIAQQCRTTEPALARIMQGHLTAMSNVLFNKILRFYCYICYDKNGHHINSNNNPYLQSVA